MEAVLEIFVKDYCESDRELLDYLSGAVSGIIVRLKNAADHQALGSMFVNESVPERLQKCPALPSGPGPCSIMTMSVFSRLPGEPREYGKCV